MNEMPPRDDTGIQGEPHFQAPEEVAEVKAWEQVDAGRYMPRRIKGSCKGRALG